MPIEVMGPLPGPPSWVSALKSHPTGVGRETVTLTVWKPAPSMVPEFQDQPRVGRALWMRLSPSLTSCSRLCCHEAHFLGGAHLFQVSDPTMGTSLVGATLPNCIVFTTHRGGEQQGDLGSLLLPRSRRRSSCHSAVPELGKRPSDTSGTPSHTRLAHPALPCSCQVAGRWDVLQESRAAQTPHL